MQCNSCTNVVISDCIIGPQNNNIPLLGRYTHARAFLPRLKQLQDEYGEEEITFYNRDTMTVNDLIERLVNQMDMIYHYVNDGVEYDEDDPEWIATQKLFLNPTGWMDGIFLFLICYFLFLHFFDYLWFAFYKQVDQVMDY